MADQETVATPEAAATTPSGSSSRDAILAELDAMAQPDEAAPPVDPLATDDATEAAADDAQADEVADAELPDTETVDPDPDLSKRLAEVQRAERAGKEAVNRERQAFEAERQAFTQEREQYQRELSQWQQARERIRYSPVEALEALGLTADDYEDIARAVYLASPAAKDKPQAKAQTQQSLRLKEIAAKAEAAEKRALELEQRIQAADEARQVEAHLDQFYQSVVGVKTDDTPLLAKMLDKSPDRARQAILSAGESLYKQTGEIPSALDVRRLAEQNERAELESRGIDVAQLFAKTPASATGEKTKRPATLEPLGRPTQSSSQPRDREAEIAEVREQLMRGGIGP